MCMCVCVCMTGPKSGLFGYLIPSLYIHRVSHDVIVPLAPPPLSLFGSYRTPLLLAVVVVVVVVVVVSSKL